MKRLKSLSVFVFLFAIMFLFLSGFAFAQENISGDEEFSDAGLEVNAGITPDSAFYFVDKFFDNFGDDLENREEKVAEIKAMVEEGKFEEARIALERYKEHAERFEKEVSPDESEDAKRSAAAIKNVLRDIEEDIPEDERGDFVEDVIAREGRISTSAEIASKIKDLCETLAEIDPLEYSRVCKTGEDAPEWQKRLDRDLTDKQREEAEKFGKIMSQCFRTSGQECECEEIPFTDFAEMCSIAAPLATKCDLNDDEEACEKLDEIEMPELPPHLQDVFDDLERDISDSQFDLHAPEECREAGVTSPKECRKIMIQTHAPEECREALIEADIQGEREGREICEKIMFELNAPKECIDAGLTDHRECGKLMFELNAPKECIDAGLTGEYESDHRKCEDIARGSRGFNGEGNVRGPEGFGRDCRSIEDSEERLKCYDSASSGVREYHDDFDDRFRETHDAQRQCAESCFEQKAAFDFSDGNCKCIRPEEFNQDDFDGGDFRGEDFDEGRDSIERCSQEGGKWDGRNCIFDGGNFDDKEFNEGEFKEDGSFDDEQHLDDGTFKEDGTFNEEFQDDEAFIEEDSATSDSGNTGSQDTEGNTKTEETTTDSTSEGTTGAAISGNVVLGDSEDNSFLKYFFRIFG